MSRFLPFQRLALGLVLVAAALPGCSQEGEGGPLLPGTKVGTTATSAASTPTPAPTGTATTPPGAIQTPKPVWTAPPPTPTPTPATFSTPIPLATVPGPTPTPTSTPEAWENPPAGPLTE